MAKQEEKVWVSFPARLPWHTSSSWARRDQQPPGDVRAPLGRLALEGPVQPRR